jgi:diguanylate cyclase (GGDEF)-like protein
MGRSRTTRAARPVFAVSVAVAAVALAVGTTQFTGVHNGTGYRIGINTFAVVCTLVAAAGAWRQRATLGRVGLYVALALMMSTLAGIGVTANQFWIHSDAYPNWTDIPYLSVYGFLMATTMAIIRQRKLDRNLPALLDATIFSVGIGVLSFAFYIVDIAADDSVTVPARLVSILYPVCDLLVLGLIARLLFGAAAARAPLLMLTGGMLMLLIGDVGYIVAVYAANADSYDNWIDALYLIYDALLALSLWQTSSPRIVEIYRGPHPRVGPLRLSILAVGALLGPVTVLAQNLAGNRIAVRVAAAGSIVLFVLTLIRMAMLIRDVESQKGQLEVLARTDGLTGLINRRTFDFELGRAMTETLAEPEQPGPGGELHLALIDLDHFKAFNDTYGHGRGDQLLRECAAHWSHELEQHAPGARLARYGGEEFVVVFRNVSRTEALTALEAMLAATPEEQSFSGGLARWHPGEPALDLINRADERLYAAKKAGRKQIVAQSPVTENITTVDDVHASRG